MLITVVSIIDSKGSHLVESASIFIRIPGVTDESFPPTLHILRTDWNIGIVNYIS